MGAGDGPSGPLDEPTNDLDAERPHAAFGLDRGDHREFMGGLFRPRGEPMVPCASLTRGRPFLGIGESEIREDPQLGQPSRANAAPGSSVGTGNPA